MGETRASVMLEKIGDREDVFRGHCVEADVRRATVEGISRTPAWYSPCLHEAADFPERHPRRHRRSGQPQATAQDRRSASRGDPTDGSARHEQHEVIAHQPDEHLGSL